MRAQFESRQRSGQCLPLNFLVDRSNLCFLLFASIVWFWLLHRALSGCENNLWSLWHYYLSKFLSNDIITDLFMSQKLWLYRQLKNIYHSWRNTFSLKTNCFWGWWWFLFRNTALVWTTGTNSIGRWSIWFFLERRWCYKWSHSKNTFTACRSLAILSEPFLGKWIL